jgi:LysM repeat protein
MDKKHLRFLVFTVLIILALTITGCTRSASTPPPSETEEATSKEVDDTQATMDAVRSAILTQTAQAGEATATEAPAATETPETSGTPVAATPEATPTSGEVTEYTVQTGDWIWKIARQFGVEPEDIIELNDLTSPSQIQPGLVLKIPAPSGAVATTEATGEAGGVIHVVQTGEWIWQIARKYGVDPQSIIDANNLTNPSRIYPGQELVIP